MAQVKKTPVTMLSGFLGSGASSGFHAALDRIQQCLQHTPATAATATTCNATTAAAASFFSCYYKPWVALCATGKTTLLRYLLENSKEKVACIVNDVASINIDAKLVRNDRNRARSDAVNTTADLADTIELANGCACE
jgi:hypothetical protein